MPIDTSRLKNSAMRVRGVMDKIGDKYASLEEKGTRHLADLDTLETDVTNLDSDLSAAINTMGNSSGQVDTEKH